MKRKSNSRRRGRALNRRTGGYLGQELKFRDTFLTDAGTQISTENTWTLIKPNMADTIATAITANAPLTGVTQGTGQSERDGRKYVVKSIHVTGEVTHEETLAATTIGQGGDPAGDIFARIILVQDKQCNGADLTPSNVMNAGTPIYASQRNLEHHKRFKVLGDKTLVLRKEVNTGGLTAATTSSFHSAPFSFYKRMVMPITTKDTSAAIGDMTDNAINLIIASNDKNTKVTYTCRVRFID